MKKLYDIHGLLKIRSENLDLDNILSYFSTSTVSDLDLMIKIDKININPDIYDRLERFDLGEKEVVERRKFGTIQLRNLFNRTELNATSGYARLRHLLTLVEHILEFKLLTKNHVLIHSACISKNGEGCLICAPRGTGKTMVTLKLVKDKGFSFLSDDRTIISGDGRAHCFPKNVKLSLPHVSEFGLNKKVKLKLLIGELVRQIPVIRRRLEIAHNVPVTKVIKNAKIEKRCEIGKLLILQRAKNEGVTEIDLGTAVKLLILSNRWERIFWVDHLFIPYMYSDPKFDLQKLEEKERDIVENALKDALCYEMRFRKYAYSHVEKFLGG